MSYQLEKIRLNLKVNWKISRNQSLFKENFILKQGEYSSEIAPNIRYNETTNRIEKEFDELCKSPDKLESHWCNSFKNAVTNLRLKVENQGDLNKALGSQKINRVLSSFSVPIMELDHLADYLKQNPQYHIYKLKITDHTHLPLLYKLAELAPGKKIRIDANEGFSSLEDYLVFEQKIANLPIEFIEQPFKADMVTEYQKLRPISKFEIIVDESVEEDFDPKVFQSICHGVNIKLMKAAGVLNAKDLLVKAHSYGLKTMMGCMIESSLGISEAFALAQFCDYFDLDGSLLVANDPFSHLISEQEGFLILNS